MWNTLTPQQQAFLVQMMRGQGGAATMQSGGGLPAGPPIPGAAAQMAPGLALQTGQQANPYAAMGQQLGNPLMAGGNSAVSPQQQAAMQQYMQLMGSPQGWGATANGNVPVWQLLMGRSPWYGQGTSVP